MKDLHIAVGPDRTEKYTLDERGSLKTDEVKNIQLEDNDHDRTSGRTDKER